MESMKMIGVPARVRATKITPSTTSWVTPAARSPQQTAHSTAPIARPPARPAMPSIAPARPRAASRAAYAASARA